MTNIVARFNAYLFSIVRSFVDVTYVAHSVIVEPHKSGKGVILCALHPCRTLVVYDEEGFASKAMYVRMAQYNDKICKENSTTVIEIHEGDDTGYIIDNGDVVSVQPKAINHDSVYAWRNVVQGMQDFKPEDGLKSRIIKLNGKYLNKFRKAAKRLTGYPKITIVKQSDSVACIRFDGYPDAFGLLVQIPIVDKGLETATLPPFMD